MASSAFLRFDMLSSWVWLIELQDPFTRDLVEADAR